MVFSRALLSFRFRHDRTGSQQCEQSAFFLYISNPLQQVDCLFVLSLLDSSQEYVDIQKALDDTSHRGQRGLNDVFQQSLGYVSKDTNSEIDSHFSWVPHNKKILLGQQVQHL